MLVGGAEVDSGQKHKDDDKSLKTKPAARYNKLGSNQPPSTKLTVLSHNDNDHNKINIWYFKDMGTILINYKLHMREHQERADRGPPSHHSSFCFSCFISKLCHRLFTKYKRSELLPVIQ